MNIKTQILIQKLKQYNSKEELLECIKSNHLEFKMSLLSDGYKLHAEDSLMPDCLIGNQTISEDTSDSYEEISFIKEGVEGNWIGKVDDIEKFSKIKKEIETIIEKLQ